MQNFMFAKNHIYFLRKFDCQATLTSKCHGIKTEKEDRDIYH